jgi:hypothetical protein
MALRILVALFLLAFSQGLSYIIGFIILQSKARNEVLSLITAFQNPIDFSQSLYFYYAFVYLFITLITLLPFGIYLFYGRKLLKKIKRKIWFVCGIIFWIIIGGAFFWTFLKSVVPLIPYYLFYASKNTSAWEGLINYLAFSKEMPLLSPLLDLDIFQKEIFISLQSGNMTVMLLVFLFFTIRGNAATREKHIENILKLSLFESHMILYLKSTWNIFKIHTFILHLKIKKSISFVTHLLFLFIFLFFTLLVFASHTAFQLGGFGKSLAQFDTDFVTVEYNLNGQTKIVEGVRVYYDKNYIVLRDSQNNIHNIFTDQIHIQTKRLHLN